MQEAFKKKKKKKKRWWLVLRGSNEVFWAVSKMDALQILEVAQEEMQECCHRPRGTDRSNPPEEFDDQNFTMQYRISIELFCSLLNLIKCIN